MSGFLLLAVAATLGATALVVWPLLRNRNRNHGVAATVAALIIPTVVLVSYLAASNYTWSPTQAVTEEGGAAPLEQAVAALRKRLAASPDDADGWVLLGNSLAALQRPGEAMDAFRRAIALTGQSDSRAVLGLAEAEVMLDQNSLLGPAGDAVERVLAIEPANPKALWYGGMRALMRGEQDAATSRWQSLLALNPPEQVRNVIEAELAALNRTEREPGTTTASNDAIAGAAGTVLRVGVDIAPRLRERVRAGAPLFVFVRDPATAGPPIAVVRREAAALPLDVVISDRDAMIPGRTLSAAKNLEIVARVSNSGDPIEKTGDLVGRVAVVGTGTAAQVLIDRVVGGS